MKFLVDMNLSPAWCPLLMAEGWESVHWSAVGAASTPDDEIMQYALAENRVVFTHDLDFGAVLVATRATGPSVIQIRVQDVRPQSLAPLLIPLLHQYESDLETGAILIVDEVRARLRLLPLVKKPRK